MQILVNNKKAHFEYEILEKVEAGIVLKGWEVKSLKAGHGNIASSYIKEKNNELFIVEMGIPVWKTSSFIKNEAEKIDRKLLLKKNEIRNLSSKVKQDRLTMVPLEIISNDKGLVKVIVGLVKGKKKYDKRQKLKEKDLSRRISQERRDYNF